MATLPSPADGTINDKLLSLMFPARADRLKLVRRTVSEAAEFCGCGPDAARSVVIAVDEACQNVIRHAYGDTFEGEISLEMRREGGNVVILVRDFADPVDPGTIKPRALDDIRPGGLGTHFIREVMDEVTYADPPEGGGNLLRMVKRIV